MTADPCRDCGLCCAKQGTPPFTRCGDDRYDDGRPCLWYDTDTKRCRHYEHRPAVCREFQAASDDCARFRRADGLVPLPVVPAV